MSPAMAPGRRSVSSSDLILGPVIRSSAPPARAEFIARYMPNMLLIMPTLMTMGFGVARHRPVP